MCSSVTQPNKQTEMVRYAIHLGNSRDGEFEFLSSTQSHWTKSLKDARLEAEAIVQEHMASVYPPYTKKQAIEETGKVRIFKLTVEEVT